MVAVELEVMAKKMDRFGWDRDRGSMAHDRMLTDWMDALQDYPLDEVKRACREHVREFPRKMPNEGDILQRVIANRGKARKAVQAMPTEQNIERVTPERANEILAAAGFAPNRFGK